MTAFTSPHFLCIGAQKAGTTWLYQNLQPHPQIWMPPLKELHVFDSQGHRPFLFHLGERSRAGRQARMGIWTLRHDPLWAMRYLLSPRTDSWYSALFTPAPGQIAGEITPAYARLSSTVIARIQAAWPRTKVIYLLRDPIERAWSQLRMNVLKTSGRSHYPTDEEMMCQLEAHWLDVAEHSDYLDNLMRWRQRFSQDQMMIGFFDQLVEEPATLLKTVLHFLEVAADDDLIPPDVHKPRNQRPPHPMPESIYKVLLDRLYPQMIALHTHFDNPYTARWLENAGRGNL